LEFIDQIRINGLIKMDREKKKIGKSVLLTSSFYEKIQSIPSAEDINRQTLSNGIIVLSRENRYSSSVFISGILPAGSLYDNDDKLGLSDFTSSALMRGTHNKNFLDIYRDLESIGASLGVASGTHSATFNGRALSEDFEILLSILADILRYPIFPEKYLEQLRTQLLTSLSIRSQDTSEMAALLFDQIVYKDHPYRHPEEGYVETVQTITRSDIADFHKKHYGPNGMIISIVGNIDPNSVIETVEKVLGDWENQDQAAIPVINAPDPLPQTIKKTILIPEKTQSDIVIGVAGPSRFCSDYLPIMVGNNIFGQFGMMGRLGEIVREKAGLAYYISSNVGGGPGPSPWEISAGVAPEKIDKSIELIIQEIKNFSSQPVSEDELSDSKANIIGRMPLSLESNAGVAASLVAIERYQLGLDYYREYPDMIRSVSAEDILKSTQKYLNAEKLAIAIAGSQG
jgi:zinc protease